MTTTTGDPSILKTPPTLSGGDLVSRLLAATPPYLYNVPLTSHSFFFSEMLRSFVQGKTEAGAAPSNPPSVARRRKRSWRDARDRPLELTTKDKAHHHPHHLHHHQHPPQGPQTSPQQHKDKYFQGQTLQQTSQQQQQQQSPDLHVENRFKSHTDSMYPSDSKSQVSSSSYERKSSPTFGEGPGKSEPRSDFSKQSRGFFDDSSRLFSSEQSAQQEAIFATSQKVKPEEGGLTPGERKGYERPPSFEDRSTKDLVAGFAADKSKMDFAGRGFLPGLGVPRQEDLQQTGKQGFGLSNGAQNADFLPSGSLWYPPYPGIAQSYPGIDPLHLFIDFRVSGHIWDRKLNERQLPFKSKHCSAFSVPQTKEYNRPLNLTRDEATASSSSAGSARNSVTKNARGTHSILRNLSETYKDIREMEKGAKAAEDNEYQGRSLPKSSQESSSSSKEHQAEGGGEEEPEGKDLRALIGLELVVDYVKEPAKESPAEEEQSAEVVE